MEKMERRVGGTIAVLRMVIKAIEEGAEQDAWERGYVEGYKNAAQLLADALHQVALDDDAVWMQQQEMLANTCPDCGASPNEECLCSEIPF